MSLVAHRSFAQEAPFKEPSTSEPSAERLHSESKIQSKETLESAVVLFGHNLTPTTYTLKKDQATVGFYAFAYGITDNWFIGTSPWIDLDYNMPMINTRIGLLNDSDKFRVSLDASYFKTFHFGNDKFQQESIFARLIASRKISENYIIHGSFGYQYFWEDSYPYSLRLSPTNGDRYTTSLSTLHEINFSRSFGIFAEIGLLGLNYASRYLHWGLSGFIKWPAVLLQIGLSQSRSLGPVHFVNPVSDYWYERQVVLHPEIQLQFYF